MMQLIPANIMTPLHNWYVQWCLVGVVMALPFVWPGGWWLAICGVAGYVYILESHAAPTQRQLLLGGMLAGTLQYVGVLSWVWSVYPMDWLPVNDVEAGVLIFGYTIVAAWVLGLSKVAVLYMHRWFRSGFLYILPVWWLVCELLAAWLFSLHALGPGSEANLNFSYGMVGYVLAEHTVLLIGATVAGAYGLSVLVVLMGVLLYSLMCSAHRYRLVYLLIAVVLLASTASVTWFSPVYDETVAVAALETTYDRREMTSDELDERNRGLVEGVVSALNQGNEYVVLPEDVRFSALFQSEQDVFDFIETHAVADDVVLIDSSRIDTDGVAYLRAFIYDTKTAQVYTVDKQLLVPQGEYMPYLHGRVLRWLGYGTAVDVFAHTYNYVPGPMVDQSHLPAHIPRILFCYESSSPHMLQQLAAQTEAPFIAHPVSHSVFNQPKILQQQLDQMLRVQARFAGVTVIQAGNNAPAARY